MSSVGSDCRLAMKVRVTSGSVFQVMMAMIAGQTQKAVARKAIG